MDQAAELDAAAPSDGIMSLIGLAGTWAGTASICCTAVLSRHIASRMLAIELPDVNEDVLDAISEISNMIIGGFKTNAETYYGPLGLSIPTVFYGLQFSARTANKEQCVVVPFECDGERMAVKVCLAPNRGLPRLATRGSIHLAHH